ncbi:hypothetical protein DL93DRAFT_2079643 [Clavulina sp. PMI_390]|nr:hypothetical protein DL93DRAFT_2079643 [Clavulina sp. PMI_390]
MTIDDIDQDGPAPSSSLSRRSARRGVAPAYPTRGGGPGAWNLMTILSFPFSLVGGLLRFIFRILRFPFIGPGPSLRPGLRGTATLFGPPTSPEDAATAAERFVRELEDETGGMTVSHAAASGDEKAALSGSGKATDSTTRLPDFFIGSYEQALKAAETELKVLCVILLTNEHDDVPEFRGNVLPDPDFVKVLTNNDFIVYAGDIRTRDAYQTSLRLGATTYPFVAFVSLHPVPQNMANSASNRTPKLTVLSRHEGLAKTTAPTLTTYISATLLPRVTPLLTRLRTERWERAQERKLREEQDRAFAEAAARDRERTLKKQAEERAAAEAARKAEEERLAKATTKANAAAWRRYARRALLVPEAKDGVRIGVRMPDGKRILRTFDRANSTVDVYIFVETLFIPASEDPSSDPTTPPPGFTTDACAQHEWAFGLVTSFPRKEILPSKETLLGDIPEFKGGANLALEMKESIDADEDNDEDEDDEDADDDE